MIKSKLGVLDNVIVSGTECKRIRVFKRSFPSLFSHSPRSPNEDARRGFPWGAVVKNLPANAGGTSSTPGPGRSHMPQSN